MAGHRAGVAPTTALGRDDNRDDSSQYHDTDDQDDGAHSGKSLLVLDQMRCLSYLTT
jgi:hypothetical protein